MEHCFEVETLCESGVEAGKQIAASPIGFTPAAMADAAAWGVMEGLRLSGLLVPEGVSATGFDNLPECRYFHPKLTSVSQRLEEKAKCAGEYLFSMPRDGSAITGDKKWTWSLWRETLSKHLNKSAMRGKRR